MSARVIQVIDSHTAGEPTRVVITGAPDLGSGLMQQRLQRLRSQHDSFRSSVVLEPRGSDVMVGALLLAPVNPGAVAGVIFFNDVGYLGMCGHGTIGLVRTLAHMGRLHPGEHTLETPVGDITACLHEDMSVTVRNVPAFRYQTRVNVDVPGYGSITGDIAWGGNWFFLSRHPQLDRANVKALLTFTTALRSALGKAGITGDGGAEIDHIELFGPPQDAANSARNFVLCPGAAFDRSPCGTGTCAKMACLYADGLLEPGQIWRQEGILGTVFEGSFRLDDAGTLLPSIRGRAWITAESTLLFADDDPCAQGFQF